VSFCDCQTIAIRQYNFNVYEYKRGYHCCNYHICVAGFDCCTGGNSLHSIVTRGCFLSNTSRTHGGRLAMAGVVACVGPGRSFYCDLWSAYCRSDVFSVAGFSPRFDLNSVTDCGSAPAACGYKYAIRNTDSCADSDCS